MKKAGDNLRKFCKKDKWGLIEEGTEKVLIKPIWDVLEAGHYYSLVFCAIKEESEKNIGIDDRLKALASGLEPIATPKTIEKWGVHTHKGTLIIGAKLDKRPKYIKPENIPRGIQIFIKYYLLKKDTKYGVLCSDGRVISDTRLYKKDAMSIIKARYKEQF